MIITLALNLLLLIASVHANLNLSPHRLKRLGPYSHPATPRLLARDVPSATSGAGNVLTNTKGTLRDFSPVYSLAHMHIGNTNSAPSSSHGDTTPSANSPSPAPSGA